MTYAAETSGARQAAIVAKITSFYNRRGHDPVRSVRSVRSVRPVRPGRAERAAA